MFILWQLFFLFGSNLVGLIGEVRSDTSYQENFPKDWLGVINKTFPDWLKKQGHAHDVLHVVKDLTSRWEELSGQPQGWSLFAPEIARQITFVAVELRWDDPNQGKAHRERMAPFPPELVLSENEPRDKTRFFRWGKFRLRKYESYLDVVLRVYEDETLEQAVERWGRRIRKKVYNEEDNIQEYLKMRTRHYLSQHPGRPRPRQAILLVRRFEIPKPEDFSEEWYKDPRDEPLRQLPIARCLVDPEGEYGEVEWYSPTLKGNKEVTGRFLSLRGNVANQKHHDNDNDDNDD
jgi:hypothetical protein